MNGHGQKLTRKSEQALVALLAESTLPAAAARAGVSEATIARWLRNPQFRAAYRDARRQIVEAAIGTLQGATSEAVETLRRNLTHDNGNVQVRAAVAILDHATKAIELMDLAERVEALEQRSNAHGRHSWAQTDTAA